MKLVVPIILLAAVMLNAQQPISTKDKEVVFKDVQIVSMENDKIGDRQTVVVRNGKIESIGAQGKVKYGKDAVIIDGKGKYLMPGLAEMHAHVPPIDDLEPMKNVLKLFAANGITTIRGMLGHPKHLELRGMVDRGEIVSPDFFTTGPSFNGMSVTSPEQGAAMVRKQKEMGYDFMKMHPGLLRNEFDSIAAVANILKMPFAGHVSFGVGVWRAIEAGYSSIDHLDGFIEGIVPGIEKMNEQQTGLFGMLVADQADQSQIPKLVRALKSNNIWVVPTQSLAERWMSPDYSAEDFAKDPDAIYMNKKTIEQWTNSKNSLKNNPAYDADKVRRFVELRRKMIKACQDGGVGLLLGCDAPQVFNVPGFSTHNELEYLVRSGLTPFQALQSGTSNVGKYLNKKSGLIKVGYDADLILVNTNPLADIKATRNISGVMVGMNWLSKGYIDAELKNLVAKD
jgi:imidazolonepropionase-like amidohydrolase